MFYYLPSRLSALFFTFFLLCAMTDDLFSSEERPVVAMETTQGTILIRLFPDVAPKATENFLGLAKKGYYDGLVFHRVIRGFMLQGGDPTGTGRGGQSLWGKEFGDEIAAQVRFDRAGLLAMANRGPSTNGSQFFITTAATPWLNGKHTIFGEVIQGIDVVHKIENVPTDRNDRPIAEQQLLKLVERSSQPDEV